MRRSIPERFDNSHVMGAWAETLRSCAQLSCRCAHVANASWHPARLSPMHTSIQSTSASVNATLMRSQHCSDISSVAGPATLCPLSQPLFKGSLRKRSRTTTTTTTRICHSSSPNRVAPRCKDAHGGCSPRASERRHMCCCCASSSPNTQHCCCHTGRHGV